MALPYIVALDHETKSVVVSIRGSVSSADWVTDMLGVPEPLGDWLPQSFRDVSMQFHTMHAIPLDVPCPQAEGKFDRSVWFHRTWFFRMAILQHSTVPAAMARSNYIIKKIIASSTGLASNAGG